MTGRKDIVQGTLDLLVLRITAAQPMHGWGRQARFHSITKAGRKQLAREKQYRKSITTAVDRVLEGA